MANPNVFQQLIQAPRSVMDYSADIDRQQLIRAELQQRQRQNALQDMAAQQQVQKQNALQRAAAGWGATTTDDQRIQSLRQDPLTFDAADALEKSVLERSKTKATVSKDEAEAEKIRLATSYMQRDRHLQSLANVTDPQAAAAWIAQGVQLGEFGMADAQRITQGIQSGQIPLDLWKQRAQQGGMTLQQQAQDRLAQLTQAETARHNQATEANTVRGQDLTAETTRRGQNMTDARSRESNQLTREANANVYDPERGVLVNKATGLARPAATFDGKPLASKQPESMKKELASIDAQLSVLDGAIKDVTATPDAFTFKRGLATMAGPLTESVAGRMDSSAERDARSYVFNVVSKVINERAGAAQSAQELARLRSFLPAETDNSQQIVDKLESFKGYLADLGNGYQPGKYQPQAKPVAPAKTKSGATASNW